MVNYECHKQSDEAKWQNYLGSGFDLAAAVKTGYSQLTILK